MTSLQPSRARVLSLMPAGVEPCDGGDAEAWFALGCDLEARSLAQARQAYERALERDPRHAGAQVNLGRLLHEAGDPAGAERRYRLAIEAAPADALAWYNLGVALEDEDRPAAARAAYERAVSLDARLADAHWNLARLHESAGERSRALGHLLAYARLAS